MIKLALLVSLALVSPSIGLSLPRCFCPIKYDPVCGTDGRVYLSECMLKCAKRSGADVELKMRGPCTQPPCTCPADDNPVCGSNGVTYGNDCLLNCATIDDSTLSIAHAGSCKHTVIVVDQPDCSCSDEFKPVCGTDGVTYNNDCLLKCAGHSLVRRGPCEPPCTCSREEKPVCGSDGITYDNPCLLNCATKNDYSLRIVKSGTCAAGGLLIVEQPGCVPCENVLKPVCGSDLVTYNNECVLKCAGVGLLKEGPCEPPCECPPGGSPVCGSNGVTYENDCMLNCATKDDSTLRVARTGACEPSCSCPGGGRPVCGSDGVTYPNVCLLNCATKDNSRLSVARPGSC